MTSTQTLAPFDGEDAFKHTMNFLTLPELGKACQVNKQWKGSIDNGVWRSCCQSNQFPLVINGDGTERDIRKDVAVLYERTVSGYTLSQWVGRPVEMDGDKIVPARAGHISDRVFNMLSQEDPFNPGQLIDLVFVCDFRFIQRTLGDQKFPFRLDENGNLTRGRLETPQENAVIAFSTWNVMVLCDHPLKGTEGLPVVMGRRCAFTGKKSAEVFSKTNTCALKNETHYMWKNTVIYGRSAADQKATIRAATDILTIPKMDIISFRLRAIFDGIKILESKPGSSGSLSNTSARFHNDPFIIEEENISIPQVFNIGYRAVSVEPTDDVSPSRFVGVIPGGPAGD